MAPSWNGTDNNWFRTRLFSSCASCKHSGTRTICFFLSRHCFVPSCLLLCACVFSSNLAIMAERNQEKGLKKNKSKKIRKNGTPTFGPMKKNVRRINMNLNFRFRRNLFSKLVLVSRCFKKDPLDNLLLESKRDRQSVYLISSVTILLYECYRHVLLTRMTVVFTVVY